MAFGWIGSSTEFGQETIDQARAGKRLGLGTAVAVGLGPDAGEGEKRPQASRSRTRQGGVIRQPGRHSHPTSGESLKMRAKGDDPARRQAAAREFERM